MKNYSLLLLVSTLVFTSCSNELSRGKAEKLINEFFEYPNVEYTTAYKYLDGSIWGTHKDEYQLLEELGLIEINDGSSSFWGKTRHISFTNEGKMFDLSEKGLDADRESPLDLSEGKDKYVVISNIRDFKEVTGITYQDENNGKVEFSVVRKSVTPFGEAKGIKEGEIVKYSIPVKRYDDGWRIYANKSLNLKPTDFEEAFKLVNNSPKVSESDIIGKWISKKLLWTDPYSGTSSNRIWYATAEKTTRGLNILYGCSLPDDPDYASGGRVGQRGNFKLIRQNLTCREIQQIFEDGDGDFANQIIKFKFEDGKLTVEENRYPDNRLDINGNQEIPYDLPVGTQLSKVAMFPWEHGLN